jgi:hypothetical protein
MTTSDQALSSALSWYGTLNFTVDCNSENIPARIVMNDCELIFALADGSTPPRHAGFLEVSISGVGPSATLAIGSTNISVLFSSQHDFERTRRVVGVRQDLTADPGLRLGRPTDVAYGQAAPEASARPSFGGYVPGPSGFGRSAIEQYRQWMGWVRVTSMALLIVAWLNLAVGIIFAFYLIANHAALSGLLTLLIAAAAAAMPLCLASLARMTLFRYESRDDAR